MYMSRHSKFESTSEVSYKKLVARSDLKKILYENETTFTFEKYVTKRKNIFNVLEKFGFILYGDLMVEKLLE